MRASVLSSRPGRVVALLVVAAAMAAGLVVLGAAGPPRSADAAVSPGTTQLVSVDQDRPFRGSGQAAVSADGRYVAFATLASLDPVDVHRDGDSDLDVYVRDLRENRTVLLSHGVLLPLDNTLRSEGLPDVLSVPANGHSGNPSISANGRYVAFQTTANNLGAQDHDRKSDVVVVDRDPDGDGIFDEQHCPLLRHYCHEFTRVSPDGADDQGREVAGAATPSISAAGDAVAWVGVWLPGAATYPSEGDATHQGIPVVYRSTLTKGPTGAITAVQSQQVRANAEGLQIRGETAPALSGDAQRLALVAATGQPSGEGGAVEVGSAVLGVDFTAGPLADTGGEVFAATRLDVDETGTPLALPPRFTAAPTISGDGRLVAFTAPGAGSSVVRTAGWETGPIPRSEVSSIDLSGAPVHGTDPALSSSGRYLAFTTAARNTHNGVDGPDTTCNPGPGGNGPGGGSGNGPGNGPGNGLGIRLSIDIDIEVDINPLIYLNVDLGLDISLRLGPGGLALTIRLGPSDLPTQPPAPPPPPLPPADSAAVSHCDVVVRDLVRDSAQAAAGLPRLPAELASPSQARDCVADLPADATCEGDDASGYPALSADGGVVAFESEAATLVPDDRNGHVQDVFARTFAPRLVADPLNFFTVEPGSSILGSANPRHQGFGPLFVESLTITGPNAADFTVTAQTCVGRILQGGDSCLVTVRFSPSELGIRRAVLEIRYRGTGSPLRIPLTGSGDRPAPRAFTSTPEPLDFGAQLPLSTSPPGDITVRNTGAAPLTVSAVSIPTDTGPEQFPQDYTIVADNCTGQALQPDATCTVTVQFSPQGVGPRPAVLRFDDDAPNAPHLASLQGSGIAPSLQVNPAVVREQRVTTLFGSGFAPLRTVTVQLAGLPVSIVVTADAAGNFSTPLVIFPNSTPGERIVTATIDAHEPPISATATVLIVPGTLAPPELANGR